MMDIDWSKCPIGQMVMDNFKYLREKLDKLDEKLDANQEKLSEQIAANKTAITNIKTSMETSNKENMKWTGAVSFLISLFVSILFFVMKK